MDNPRPIHLTTDDYWRSLGWLAVARDKDGHVISTCDYGYRDVFKDWLLECFDDGLTVVNLARTVSAQKQQAPTETNVNEQGT